MTRKGPQMYRMQKTCRGPACLAPAGDKLPPYTSCGAGGLRWLGAFG